MEDTIAPTAAPIRTPRDGPASFTAMYPTEETAAVSTVNSQTCRGFNAPNGSTARSGNMGSTITVMAASSSAERSSGQVRRDSQPCSRSRAARTHAVATPPAAARCWSPRTHSAPSAKTIRAATTPVTL